MGTSIYRLALLLSWLLDQDGMRVDKLWTERSWAGQDIAGPAPGLAVVELARTTPAVVTESFA